MKRNTALHLLILALFFLSGISGLIYQIVWTRMLVLVFGNTMLAMSTVLSAFMGGLAAGSYVLGRFIDKKPRQLIRLYAWLEAGIGLFALAFPLLLSGVTPFYMSVYGAVEGNIFLVNLVRFAVCFALISVPTFLMGGTLPVLIKRFVKGVESIGLETGFLYGLNTVGAVVGTVASGYFLLRILGMEHTTWVAVAINLGVAVVAWLVSSADHEEAKSEKEDVERTTSEPPGEVTGYGRTTVAMVLVGIGLSGFCALAYEVLWTRMLNLFLHNNIYSFTGILATFLTGIALGSLIYSRFLSRSRNQVALFIGLEMAIGVLSYITPFLFKILHGPLFNKLSEALTLAKTSVIMIGPTILMGIAVPMAVQICQRGKSKEGTSVGTVYAINTFGAILGAFAAGFIILPSIGLQGGVVFVASLNVLAGLLPLMTLVRGRARVIWATVSIGALSMAYLLAPPHLFKSLFEDSHPSAEILHYKEGRVANVVVYDFARNGYKDLHLNAVEEASSRLWHVQAFKLLGILPVMVHDEPDDALMVAFGAGMSAGATAGLVSSLDCVDLNPDIDEVAEVFTRENLDVINNPKLKRIVNDGRNALLLSPRKYSLIISDATNPKMFDSWTLYSQEFYQLVKERLKPGGVFAQWFLIPLPGDAIPVILNTFRSVFPHMSLWCVYGSSQCVMLGTPERLEIDFQSLQEKLELIFESSGMAEFGIESTEKFLSFFLLGEDHLGELLDGFEKIGTDDLPYAQFFIEQDKAGIGAALDLVRYQESIIPYLTNLGPEAEAIKSRLETYGSISRRLNLGFLTGKVLRFREAEEIARRSSLGSDSNAISMLAYGPERKRYFTEKAEHHPDDVNAHNNVGFIHWKEGEYTQAIASFERAISIKPDFARAHANLAHVLIDAGFYDEAVSKLLELRELNPTQRTLEMVKTQLERIYVLRKIRYGGGSPDLYMALGRLHYENGDIFQAIDAASKAAELAPEEPSILLNLAQMYETVEFPKEALEAYSRLQSLVPEDRMVSAKQAALAELAADPDKTQSWLRKSAEVGSDPPARDEPHPSSCTVGFSLWNDHEFEGSVAEADLREAAEQFEISFELHPDDLHAYENAATIHEILGDYGKAASIWSKSLEIVPDSRYSQSNRMRVELLQKVASGEVAKSEESDTLNRLGVLARANNDIEAAVSFFQRALDKEPNTQVVWLNLAESYGAAGLMEEAAGASARAKRISSDGGE